MLTGCICMSRLDSKSVWTSSQPLTPEFSGLQSSNDWLYIAHGNFVMAHSYTHKQAARFGRNSLACHLPNEDCSQRVLSQAGLTDINRLIVAIFTYWPSPAEHASDTEHPNTPGVPACRIDRAQLCLGWRWCGRN